MISVCIIPSIKYNSEILDSSCYLHNSDETSVPGRL